MDDIDAYHEKMRDLSEQKQRLHAEYNDAYAQCEQLYAELEKTDDPGARYDLGRAIDRLERRMEQLGDSLARLNRLTEGV